jgi:vancomycin resistance protein YoaR
LVMTMVFRRNKSKSRQAILLLFRNKWFVILLILSVFALIMIIHIYMALNSDTIFPGIYVDGFDVGGLTRQEALAMLRENEHNTIRRDGIILSTPQQNYRLPLHNIEYAAEYGKALDIAYSKGRQGNFFQRIKKITELRRHGMQIDVKMCYNDEKIVLILDSIRQDVEKKSKNASIKLINGKFEITQHQTGIMMDMKLSHERVQKSLISRALEDVQLCLVEIIPDITTDMVDKITYKRAQFVTYFNEANEGRAHNIRTACKKIDQQLIVPGQVFSMDKALGERTEKNGYRQAKVIVNNELVDGLGGGICQVTSTLYNAVLLSELEIIERKNHTLPLTYIDAGRDATISEGYIDFKFKNSLAYAILIDAKVVGNQVVITIWGQEPTVKNTVRIRTKIIEQIEPDGIETIVDPALEPGDIQVIREAAPGYKVEVYRDVIDRAGKVVKTELISVDRYQPQKKKIKIPGHTQKEESMN